MEEAKTRGRKDGIKQREEKNLFVNQKEVIYMTKIVIKFYEKFVTYVTRSKTRPPIRTTRRAPSKFWAVQDGHVGGALG